MNTFIALLIFVGYICAQESNSQKWAIDKKLQQILLKMNCQIKNLTDEVARTKEELSTTKDELATTKDEVRVLKGK